MCGMICLIAVLVIFGAIMLQAGSMTLALSALIVGGALLALTPVIKKGMSKKGVVLCVVCGMLLIVAGVFIADFLPSEKRQEEPVKTWQVAFTEHGFTEEEIQRYAVVLNAVGITELENISFRDNGAMNVVQCGKVFGKDDVRLHITFENHEIIYIHFTYWDKWQSEKKGIDLFSDTEGGYLAKVDWEGKQIFDADGNLITVIY